MNFKITISDRVFLSKPKTPKETAIEKSSIRIKGELTIKQISEVVLKRSFTPAEMNGISSKDWISQNIFALDFDNGFTPDDFFTRSKKLEIPLPNIIYTTFSDSPEKRKFRVLYCIEEFYSPNLHKDYEYCSWLRKGIMEIFPECDPACKNADRMFYPGKEILFYNNEPVEETWFRSLCESACIKRNINYQAKVWKKTQTYSNTIGLAENSTLLRKFDYKVACEQIVLLHKFFYNQYHLSYQELFGLATNLQYIEGGLKLMKKRMEQINQLGGGYETLDDTQIGAKYTYTHFTILSIVKYNYVPMMLSNFSPFKEDHKYHNILEYIKPKKGTIQIKNAIESIKLSLPTAEKRMEEGFNKAINYYSNIDSIFEGRKIFIINTATGLGKTRLLENVNNALICTPTHGLKDELKKRRLDNQNIETLTTPESPVFSDERINDFITGCQECDLYDLINDTLTKIKNNKITILLNNEVIPITIEDKIMAKIHSDQNNNCRCTAETVITTHSRCIFDNQFPHETVIFDEDPLGCLIKNGDCNMDFTIFDNTQWSKELKSIETFYRDLEDDKPYKNEKQFKIYDNKEFRIFCMRNKRGDLIQLLQSDFIYKEKITGKKDKDNRRLKFVKLNSLPNKNVIIMSATIPVDYYKLLFGENKIEITESLNIKSEGEIIQYTNRSFSKYQMVNSYTKSPNLYDNLFKIIGDTPIITHKPVKELLKKLPYYKGNDMKIHFGNCSGLDTYKGNDISVIGTPNMPVFMYYFYALLAGIEFECKIDPLGDRVVERNGMKFRFFTFEDKRLQNIHLSIIESQLIQACGRARSLREKCKVYLFSSLPLIISDRFITENITNDNFII